jgi:2-haloacid dehalogenase
VAFRVCWIQVDFSFGEESGMKSVKALVFDAYGTLFDVGSLAQAADRIFPGKGSAVSTGWRAKQLEYSWLRSLMGRYEDFWSVTEDALTATCNAMELSVDGRARGELMEAYLRLPLFPEAKGALQSLSGAPLAILSNGSPKMLAAIVRNSGIEGMFSQVISVDEVKTYKPNAAAYQLAVKKINVAKSQIGFVSSNFFDVAGAKTFGFKTFWINRSGRTPDELGVSPDAVLGSLTDLLE